MYNEGDDCKNRSSLRVAPKILKNMGRGILLLLVTRFKVLAFFGMIVTNNYGGTHHLDMGAIFQTLF